jgi:hypothetical protein
MYSITQSPSIAVDLAHALMDDNVGRARGARRTTKQPASPRRNRLRSWRPGAWTRRPSVAV